MRGGARPGCRAGRQGRPGNANPQQRPDGAAKGGRPRDAAHAPSAAMEPLGVREASADPAQRADAGWRGAARGVDGLCPATPLLVRSACKGSPAGRNPPWSEV